MDALVTLIIFLLFTSAFISIGEIESKLPVASNQPPAKEAKPPIQLTVAVGGGGFRADRSSHGIGYIVGTDVPGHVKSEDQCQR